MDIKVLGVLDLLRGGFKVHSKPSLHKLFSPSAPEVCLVDELVALNSCFLSIDNCVSFLLEFLVYFAQPPFECLGVKALVSLLEQLPEATAKLFLLLP